MACFPKQYAQYTVPGCADGNPIDMVVTYKLVDPDDRTVEYTSDHENFTATKPNNWTEGYCSEKKYDMELETGYCQYFNEIEDPKDPGTVIGYSGKAPTWIYHYHNVEDPSDNYTVLRHLVDPDDPLQGYTDDVIDLTIPMPSQPQWVQDLFQDPDTGLPRFSKCCICRGIYQGKGELGLNTP